MKKTLLLLFLCATLFSCKKSSETPDSGNNSYQPVSKGSYWKYNVTGPSGTSESIVTMTGYQIKIEGRGYYQYTTTIAGIVASPGTGYFYAENGVVMSATVPADGGSLFLKENAAVGETWISRTSSGPTAGVITSFPIAEPYSIVVKLIEKGVSRTVAGRTFKNVIHTQHSLQLNSGATTQLEDYYIAKGVGMIEAKSTDGTVGSMLVDYAIK